MIGCHLHKCGGGRVEMQGQEDSVRMCETCLSLWPSGIGAHLGQNRL